MKKVLLILLQTVEAFSEKTRDLIKKDKLESASEEIEKFVKQFSIDLRNDQNINSASIVRVKKDYGKGIISYEIYNQNRTKATQFLLSILDDIPKELELLLKKEQDSPSLNIEMKSTTDSDKKSVLEKIIGKNRLVQISFLQKALNASKSVCRVVRSDGAKGTGFLVEGSYLFTNNHVLETSKQADNAEIQFNYEENEDGKPKTLKNYKLDSSDFITDEELDFTRVKVVDTDGDLHKWGTLSINTSYVPEVDEPVNIIQHPDGGFKKISLTANEVISNNWKQYLFYKADTKPGSSGSPVFNKKWEVIALHHAGRLMTSNGVGGLQINDKGERASANRGIYFKNIMSKIIELKEKQSTGQNKLIGVKIPSKSLIQKKFFLMYDEIDRDQIIKLKKHLYPMQRNGKILLYDMHEFSAGDQNQEIQINLENSDFILAMVTYNFLFSSLDLVEVARNKGKIIIPILLNESFIEETFMKNFKPLPSNKIPVEKWDNESGAYVDILINLRKIL